MADSSSAAAASPPPTVDPQDPLPDPSWTYRRWFVFALGLALVIFAFVSIILLGNAASEGSREAVDGVVKIALRDQLLIAGLMLLYLVAPSAEQITKMLATASAWKKGVSTASFSRAVAPDGSSAEASNSAGRPPVGSDGGSDSDDVAPTNRNA